MHKRRINMLEPLIDQLNPNIYSDFYKCAHRGLSLAVPRVHARSRAHRQLCDEVARAYSEMVDIKV
jgi:hypothetical protein